MQRFLLSGTTRPTTALRGGNSITRSCVAFCSSGARRRQRERPTRRAAHRPLDVVDVPSHGTRELCFVLDGARTTRGQAGADIPGATCDEADGGVRAKRSPCADSKCTLDLCRDRDVVVAGVRNLRVVVHEHGAGVQATRMHTGSLGSARVQRRDDGGGDARRPGVGDARRRGRHPR